MRHVLVAVAGAAAHVARRARPQAGLLAAVLAVVLAGTTLLGLGALLLTTGQQQALAAALADADAADLRTDASFDVVAADPAAAERATREALEQVLAPLPTTTSSWVTATQRHLPGGDPGTPRLGYLAGREDVAEHALLVEGRWPAPPGDGPPSEAVWEAAVPTVVADELGLALGEEVVLGEEVPGAVGPGVDAAGLATVTVRVVGTFVADRDPTWDRDPLGGLGRDPDYTVPGTWDRNAWDAYGPFVVDVAPLLTADVGVGRVGVTADAVAAGADPATLDAVRGRLSGARRAVVAALGEGVRSVAVASALPRTLADAARQQAVTASGVLVVALLGGALAATALALAGRLLAARRAPETALLLARGGSRRRLVVQAVLESLVLAALAAAPAVVLARLAYAGLTRTTALAGGPAPVSAALVGAVVAGALALAGVLVAATWRAGLRPPRGRRRGGDLARSGADVLLVALAVVAVAQLRGHRLTTAGGGAPDPVLVAAPVLAVLAGTAVALRVLPAVLALAQRRVARARGLVLPLATWDLARRPHATSAAVLLVLAAATGTTAVAAGATWTASQGAQAAAEVGTDVAVPADAVGPGLPGADLAAAVGSDVVPVVRRPVGLGTLTDVADRTPVLVALDTARADGVLRGALPGAAPAADMDADADAAGWGALTAGLAPTEPAAALPARYDAAGVHLEARGTGTLGGLPLRAAVTLLVADAVGGRAVLTAPDVVLDGTAQDLRVPVPGAAPDGDATVDVLAVRLRVRLDPAAQVAPDAPPETARVELTLTSDLPVPGDPAAAPGWEATDRTLPGRPGPASATLDPGGPAGPALVVGVGVDSTTLVWEPVEVLATAFGDPGPLPVLLSADLAAASGLDPGDAVELVVAYEPVPAVVADVVPYVPSVPHGPAVLADATALTRALVVRGGLEAPVDAWWSGPVADPAAATERLAAAGVGEATTREGLAEQLRGGPLRVAVPVSLAVLVAAAAALAVAGTALHTAAAVHERALEVARLQGAGIARRSVVGVLLTEHAVLGVLAVALGAGVGAAVAAAVAPALTVARSGLRPVPPPELVWPWAGQGALLAVLLLGGALVAVPVAVTLVRRATAAHLRLGDAS